MIYTGYFAKAGVYAKAGLVPVSIARFPPKFFRGIEYKALAPTAKMLNMDLGEYEVHFERILAAQDARQVERELMMLSDGRDVVILCYEALGKYCHRHAVKDWLLKGGVECREWIEVSFSSEVVEEPVKPKPRFKQTDFGF